MMDGYLSSLLWIRQPVCVFASPEEREVKDLVKSIAMGWIKHFGVPRYLRIDEAKGFAA